MEEPFLKPKPRRAASVSRWFIAATLGVAVLFAATAVTATWSSGPGVDGGIPQGQAAHMLGVGLDTAAADRLGVSTVSEPFWTNIRLPDTLKPLNYTIFLDVYLEPSFSYTGTVDVLIECLKETDLIVLHAKGDNMSVTSTSLHSTSHDAAPRVSSAAVHEAFEQIQFKLDREMDAGEKYILRVEFQQKLSKSMTGFYRSSYVRPSDGARRWLATTHFEPTDARQAFPCFDEPHLKAKFSLTLAHAASLVALSNMPAIGEPEATEEGRAVTSFDESVTMSTYLVAFVISDFKPIQRTSPKRGLEVRVWAPEHQVQQGKLALDAAAMILEFFEDFFGQPFPLPKCDLVAIPDFAAGAMENWGLITYRSTALLVDPDESSTSNREWVISVVSHELAHQWFGNLVTMEWWDDLWLNEGFASYVQDLGADYFDPSMRVSDQFSVTTLTTALGLDALATTHPIAVTVEDPNSINSIFDAISYSKGAAVIRMLKAVIGSDTFHSGLAAYLDAHKFQNANTNDLWKAWGAAAAGAGVGLGLGVSAANEDSPAASSSSGDNVTAVAVARPSIPPLDVAAVMDTWTRQPGFPLVTVTVNASRTGYVATQSRFFASPAAAKAAGKDGEQQAWNIPLTFVAQSRRSNAMPGFWRWFGCGRGGGTGCVPSTSSSGEHVWMARGPVSGDWGGKSVGWIKANAGQIGPYRVTYDDVTWGLLADQLRRNPNALSPTDRAGLLDDAFELARASRVGLTLPLNLTRYLPREKDYLPWSAALKGLDFLGNLLRSRPTYGAFCSYLMAVVAPAVRRVGWRNGGPHLERYLRIKLFNSALKCDFEPAKAGVLRDFRRWMRGGVKLPADARGLVYTEGVRAGGRREWERVRVALGKTHSPSEEARLRVALAATERPWLLRRVLGMALDQKEIRRQDAVGVICAVARNPVGEALAWEFLQEHWEQLKGLYGALSFELGTLLKCVIGAHAGSSAFRLNAVKTFFEGRDAAAASAALAQALEQAEANVDFLQRHEAELGAWLRAAVRKPRPSTRSKSL